MEISTTRYTTKTYHQPALTSVAHPPRSRANESSKTKRERHERARLSTRRASSAVPSFFLLRLPSRLLRYPATSLPSVCCPLSLSLSLSLSCAFFLPPSLPFFYCLSFSLRNPLYPRRGSFLPLGSACEIGHRTTAGRVADESSTCSSSSCEKRLAAFSSQACVNHFSERVIKTGRRGGGYGGGTARVFVARSSSRRR